MFVELKDWFPEYAALWDAIKESKRAPERRRGIVIHHTAGGASTESLAYARLVCRWHWNKVGASGNPWRRPGGYQEQIGLDGVSREMTGLPYRGIHSGTYASNRDFIAISFQGNFAHVLPNDDQLDTAVERVARITADLKWTQPAPLITGHRDHSTTTCPGERLYRALPGVLFDEQEVTWPHLLRRGDKDEAVVVLKGLIIALGFGTQSETFDRRLDTRVRNFQESAGLVVDGIVGPMTKAALSESIIDVLPK